MDDLVHSCVSQMWAGNQDEESLVGCARRDKANDALVKRLNSLKSSGLDGPDDVSKAVFNNNG